MKNERCGWEPYESEFVKYLNGMFKDDVPMTRKELEKAIEESKSRTLELIIRLENMPADSDTEEVK